MSQSLINPLAASVAIRCLLEQFDSLGLDVSESTNFWKFESMRSRARPDSPATVYFDPEINRDLDSRAAWFAVTSRQGGKVAALIAHRVDYLEGSLSDWITGFTIELHRRRGEVVVPRFDCPVDNSRAAQIQGRVVYQGEMWVSPDYRGCGLGSLMNRFGILMHYMRWSPDYSWALMAPEVLRKMFFGSGFVSCEPGPLLDWSIGPDSPGEQREPWVSLSRAEMAQLADHIARERQRGTTGTPD